MTTSLIKACARAILEAMKSGGAEITISGSEYEIEGSFSPEDLARAVIPLVLDAAAEVVRSITDHWETPEGLIPAGEFVADAILELKPEAQS